MTTTVTLLMSSEGNPSPHLCDSIEVVGGSADYNELVCAGIHLFDQGRFKEAAEQFEASLRIHLFEQPNFKPLMRLALAYSRAGMKRESKDTLEKAELALSVVAGSAKCVEENSGFKIVYSTGERPLPLNQAEVARRMCGAAYEGYYNRPTLRSFLKDAELIEYYFHVKQEVDGPE